MWIEFVCVAKISKSANNFQRLQAATLLKAHCQRAEQSRKEMVGFLELSCKTKRLFENGGILYSNHRLPAIQFL